MHCKDIKGQMIPEVESIENIFHLFGFLVCFGDGGGGLFVCFCLIFFKY